MSLPFDPFSELDQLKRKDCRNGIAYQDLALTAKHVYERSTSGRQPGNQDEAWQDVAARCASLIDIPESEQGEISVSAKGLAKTLFVQYCVSLDVNPDWDVCETKIAWEAVGRHLANLIDSDGNVLDFAEMEERAEDWARSRSGISQSLTLTPENV